MRGQENESQTNPATAEMQVQEIPKEKTCIALITIDSDINKAMPYIVLLRKLAQDPKIKGLILHIDSPGGNGGSSEIIYRALDAFKRLKPVGVAVENQCLSAAYKVACGSDYIIAPSSADIGSIGTRWNINQYKNVKFNANNRSGDIETIILKAGDYKLIGDANVPFAKEDQDYLQQMLDTCYQNFISIVAKARNLSLDNEKVWANGKVFVASEALQLGLIDAIGGFDDALSKMKELLEKRGITIEGELEIIDYPLNESANAKK